MITTACILVFVLSAVWCADRLLHAERAAQALLPVPGLVAAWVGLLALRTPTAGRALLAFGLLDLAVAALAVLAVLRLLGGFDVAPPAQEGDADEGDDEDEGGDDEPGPPAPWPTRPAHPRRRFSASRRSARGSASRGSSRSSSGRSAPTRS